MRSGRSTASTGAMLRAGGLVCVLLMGPAQTATAQKLTLLGGPLVLRVGSVVAGGDPAPATDATTRITWQASGSGTSKITVASTCAGQSFTLSVSAQLLSGAGTGLTGVPLSHLQTRDLVTGIPTNGPNKSGEARLTYRAAATAAQGNSLIHGDDVHTLTFTLTAQ